MMLQCAGMNLPDRVSLLGTANGDSKQAFNTGVRVMCKNGNKPPTDLVTEEGRL